MLRSSFKRFVKEKIYYKYLNLKGSFQYFGEKVVFPKGSLAFEYMMKNGVYEWDNLRFILGNIIEGSTYFDIGANVGLMSIPILSQFKKVKVVSIEASTITFGYLESNWRANRNSHRWLLINKAISNTSGKEIDFYLAKSKNNLYNSMKDTSRVDFASVTKITTTTIDEIWCGLNSPFVSFIKSDIEGADLLALKGGKTCIMNCRPIILLEWNMVNIVPFGFTNVDLLSMCEEIDYSCYALPAINRIISELELSQNALTTESFLLLPKSRGKYVTTS